MEFAIFVPLALLINVACFIVGMVLAVPITAWFYRRARASQG